MSVNFTGVTFAEQKVTPSDDAIIRRAILPDGILTGCAISYSGSTLTMAAGQLMVCGRQIRHPSAQNWAVVDANSGYARLVLTIDLTRTATKDSFDQVTESIEYATAVDGFPELEQADINGTGIRYQVAACVVSLGTGGITGIVSQLEKSRVDGSGGLNFKLVGGTTQPTDPSENMIWVNTDEKITGWEFSSKVPAAPEDGMVWIKTAASSRVAFNALKKNVMMVYPVSVSQYVNGGWRSLVPYSYIDGEWVSWTGWLIEAGKTDYTLKAIGLPISYGYTAMSRQDIVWDADFVTIKGTTGYGVAYIEEKLDLTSYNKLVIEGAFDFNGKDPYKLLVWSAIGSYITSNVVLETELTESGATLDISSLKGEYIVGISMAGAYTQTINNFYME